MDYLRSMFRSKKGEKSPRKVPIYDIPFVSPSRARIVIPPKPSRISGKSIAPKYGTCKLPLPQKAPAAVAPPLDHAPEVTSGQSADVSAILFGCPVDNVKVPSPGAVRYPTNLLFPN